MKSWAVKLGKGLSAIKNEGLLRGGKKSAAAFFKLFRRVGSGDILFVSSGVGDSARFRSDNQAEELIKHGFKCSVTVQDNPFLPRYADRFKVFIFQKNLYTKTIAKLIEEIKKRKKEMIFEIDDLVYDPKYIKYMDFYKHTNTLERSLYKNGLGGEILRDDYVKTAVTSTSYLAEKIEEEGKRVFISKNKLSDWDLKITDQILLEKNSKKQNKKMIRIAYFAGTKSHDKDFATVAGVLKNILEKYRNVELCLYGPLKISEIFSNYIGRVKKFPFVPRKNHFENISKVDINLVPLEVGNPFCEARSELKFFEAGILKVPTIASETGTYSDAINDGEDGFLAKDAEEWREKLEKLIDDPGLRQSTGEKAREKVLENYTNKNSHNEEYYRYLRETI